MFVALLKQKKIKSAKVEALKPKPEKQDKGGEDQDEEDQEFSDDDEDDKLSLESQDESSGDAEARDGGMGKYLLRKMLNELMISLTVKGILHRHKQARWNLGAGAP